MQAKKIYFVTLIMLPLVALLIGSGIAQAWEPVPSVHDDPLIHMPGTQPNQVSLEDPNRCMNCHSGYNQAVEPGFNWEGSMMAQASRDFLFWATLTVAAQDSIWAIGTPNAVDLCERCHFPKGWLEGRSDPPNASAMKGGDYDGVQCDFCHRMVDPFYETTYLGTREGNQWLSYWDETNASSTPSGPAAATTYQADQTALRSLTFFNGTPFFQDKKPASPAYTENTSGQYFISPGSEKRASFADASARHKMLYSRYHKSKYFCATCHDVSNPVLANLDANPNGILPTEEKSAFAYFHVERTFSEFMLSAYGLDGGAPGIGPFAPDRYATSYANNNIAKCQDCHMRDVVGKGADKNGSILRPDGSVEHPQSGQPLHDLTGGNAWVPWVLASAVTGSPNFDPVNRQLLNQGPNVLTLDLSQGQGLNPQALLAGVERAKEQLQLAASINELSYKSETGELSFRVQNQTGHKLISGFPEGRRMFLNIRAYGASGDLLYEVNPYDTSLGTLKGMPDTTLGTNEIHLDELVYEMKPSSSLTKEKKTFHFVLGDGRYKDNRIPPKGFRIGEAAARQSEPVWEGEVKRDYFTEDEYARGYHQVSLMLPTGAASVEVNLYYQTTSREYIEFLRDEINGTATTLTSPGKGGDPAYLIQTDPFFSKLKAWGDTIWQLWDHNKDVPGAAPILMTQATIGGVAQCSPPVPTLLSATPSNQQITVLWSDVHSTDNGVTGYRLYYDQAGKSQLVAEVGLTTSYVDTGLTKGQEYCYKVTSLYTGCESAFSNVRCAVTSNQGEARVGVSELVTGYYIVSGKGNNQTKTFYEATEFKPGEGVVIRAYVVDTATGDAVANASVELTITGPESVKLNSSSSDSSGMAEAVWQTKAPNKQGAGGTKTGAYNAAVSNVSATGYTWNGAATATTFTLDNNVVRSADLDGEQGIYIPFVGR
jgi:hypothetical protein